MSPASELALPSAYGVAVVLVASLARRARAAGVRNAARRRVGAPGSAGGRSRRGLTFTAVIQAGDGGRLVLQRPGTTRSGGASIPGPVTVRLPRPPAVLGAAMASAAIEMPPGLAWTAWLSVAAVATSAATVAIGIGAGLLALGVVVAVPFLVLRAHRGRAERRIEEAVPAAMEAVARSLRSGASMGQAISEAASTTGGPLGAELASVSTGASRGLTLVAALEQMAERCRLPGPRLAAAALCLGLETGGPQARAADGVAATLRERQAVAAELRALSSQARMSALVIGLAPLGFGAFAMATDPRTADFVFGTNLGLLLLGIGLALDAVGWMWMRRLCCAT